MYPTYCYRRAKRSDPCVSLNVHKFNLICLNIKMFMSIRGNFLVVVEMVAKFGLVLAALLFRP